MIRFVDLRPADIAGVRFAFWNTVHSKFEEFYGEQAWGTLDAFYEATRLARTSDFHVAQLANHVPDWGRES